VRQSRPMAFCSRSVKLKRLRAAIHRLQILFPIERTRRSHAENESGAEPTKTTSGEAVNQALNSTTGSTPRKKYCEAKKKRSPPNGEFITELPPQKKLRSSTA